MAKVYDNATDLITFARSSSGTALRRVGYGDELVENGDFASSDGWTLKPNTNISGGKLTIDTTIDGSFYSNATRNDITITAGKLYQWEIDIESQSPSDQLWFYIGSGGFLITAISVQGTGVTRGVHVAQGSTSFFKIEDRHSTNATHVINSISVREVIFDRPTDDLVLFNHPDDIPRIEYAADGSLKGLLIEEERSNLLQYSEDFSHSSWTLNLIEPFGSGSITNAINGPDGQTTADFILPTSVSSNSHYVRSVYNGATIGEMYTISVYVKEGGYSSLSLRAVGTNAPIVNYNLATGTADDPAGTIQAVGNGWFRCSLTGEATATYLWHYVYPNQQATYTGDGTSGIYVWGAQIEEGSFPTSYIPTSGSTVTRSPDIASIPVSAFGYNQDAGTVVVDVDTFDTDYDNWAWYLDGTSDTSLYVHGSGRWRLFGGGGTIAYLGSVGETDAVIGYAYDAAGSRAVLGGGDVESVAHSQPVAVNTLNIGKTTSATSLFNGHIKSLQYYPRRLTDAQLQELTS